MLHPEVSFAEVSVAERDDDVRRKLVTRRRELLNEIQTRVRDVREVGTNSDHHTTDLRDTLDAEPEDDLVFALIQLKAEALRQINEAVRNFDEGTYGCCSDCGAIIASSRLRAMPFAVRCRDCEGAREDEHRHRVRLQRVRPASAQAAERNHV